MDRWFQTWRKHRTGASQEHWDVVVQKFRREEPDE